MIEIFGSWLSFVTTPHGLWLLPLAAGVWFYRRQQLRPTPQSLNLNYYFRHLSSPAWFADENFQLRQHNPAMTEFQWPTGLRPQLFSSRQCLHSAWPDIQAELAHNHNWQGIVWLPTSTTPRALQLTITPLTRHQPRYYMVVQQDISQQQQHQSELEQLTTHDALTGVSNRTLWLAQLEPVLQQCRDAQQHFAILLIELTELDNIQQQFGANQAQQFEQWTAQQLQRHLPAGASLGQFSDRLFAVLLTPQHCQQQPEQASLQIAQQLKLAVHGPCPLDDFDLIGKCAIGISLFPQGGEDVETLLQHADWALQQSLVQNEAICVWQRSGQATIADANLAEALQHGLKQYEFELYFQGCYHLHDKKLQALDVQLAWHSPSRGLLWLPQFRAAAEQSHLLLALERWRFSQLCQQIWQWRQQGYQLPKFRLELSPLQLQQPDLLPYLLHHLQEWQLQPELLQLRVNERYWIEQPGRAIAQLQALKQAGFYLIWQDFGEGHTALALLAEGFWSEVMLAESMINDLEFQDNQRNICASLIRLAGNHQLTCSAQSVDNEMQGYLLHVMGCGSGQGLLFDRPQTAVQISADFIQQPTNISRAG
ncbi:MAG: EAL domain-containing protein [Gammaproteobacteria bacterium]|nr:EAL domain-containing protein [Gammaproteobacteria bacterium]